MQLLAGIIALIAAAMLAGYALGTQVREFMRPDPRSYWIRKTLTAGEDTPAELAARAKVFMGSGFDTVEVVLPPAAQRAYNNNRSGLRYRLGQLIEWAADNGYVSMVVRNANAERNISIRFDRTPSRPRVPLAESLSYLQQQTDYGESTAA